MKDGKSVELPSFTEETPLVTSDLALAKTGASIASGVTTIPKDTKAAIKNFFIDINSLYSVYYK